MFLLAGKRKTLLEALSDLLDDLDARGTAEFAKLRTVSDLNGTIHSLKEEIETLKIEKGRTVEDREKRDREIEHKIGLERKRQEFEVDAAKREATLTVREENLKADRQRFEEQMKFHEDRFSQEVGYLKEMLGQVLERVPNLNASMTIGAKR